MKLKKYLKEGYRVRDISNEFHPDLVGKSMKAPQKKKINKDIHKLLKPTYFKSIPLDDIEKILNKYGVLMLQEDATPWSGFLLGGVKKTEQVYFTLGWMGEMILPDAQGFFSTKQRKVIPNAMLNLSYYKMTSGNYEVLAYVS
jgi:hypothetical protein